MFVRDNKKHGCSPYILLANITEGLPFSAGERFLSYLQVSILVGDHTDPQE
jgi:hypothetical protein